MRHVPRAGLEADSADGTAVSIVVLYWAQVVNMVIRSAFYAQIFLRRSLGFALICCSGYAARYHIDMFWGIEVLTSSLLYP